MAIKEIPVPDSVQEDYFRRVDEIQPVMITEKDEKTGRDIETGEQQRTPEGVPVWLVSFGVKQPGERVDYTHIKVAAADSPAVLDEVPYFVDLIAQPWGVATKGGVKSGLWFSCTGVMKMTDHLGKPGRKAADAPPKPPAKAAA
ncbi:MAG: hypothetical protein AAF962_23130 [Actinomycetota bacterium]